MRRAKGMLRGFTLIEMLVVIVIIAILAAILLPALVRAKQRSRIATCTNNLHQFAVALNIYRVEYDDIPFWLSMLYSNYIKDRQIFICPNDVSGGVEGSIPNRDPFTTASASQFTETDDTPANTAAPQFSQYRNTEITNCSYLYEFVSAPCSWWAPTQLYPDKNQDGIVTWKEVKQEVEMKGLQPDGSYDPNEAYRGHVPIIRCFWHVEGRFDQRAVVLNLAVENENVYVSGPLQDDWKAKK